MKSCKLSGKVIIGLLSACTAIVAVVASPPVPASPLYAGILTRDGGNPVVSNGPEYYDAEKAGPRSVVMLGADDYRMWYEAVASDANLTTAVAYASSPDGISWAKQGIVMLPSENWEGPEVSPTSVLWDPDESLFKLWYHGGGNNLPRQIGYATSPDGVKWTKHPANPVLGPGNGGAWDNGFISDCKVIKIGPGDYRMWYNARSSSGLAQVGYATSSDGVTWGKHSGNPVFGPQLGGWDSAAVLGPGVLRDSVGNFHMWYPGVGTSGTGVGSGLGYAWSNDGIAWTRGSITPVLLPNVDANMPDLELGDTVDAYLDGDTARVLYGCFNFTAGPQRAICLASVNGTSTLDSNGDGILDADATALGLDPLDPDGDTDGDGLSDVIEVAGNIGNPMDSDGDGVIDALEPGNTASDAAVASGLTLTSGDTLIITTAGGEALSNVRASEAAGGPGGIVFPFGMVGYTTTAPMGGSVTVRMVFSVDLPLMLAPFKVDDANNYTELPENIWGIIDAKTIEITVTDGDPLTDQDGINGSIDDPVAVGTIAPVAGAGGGGGCTLSRGASVDTTWILFLVISSIGCLRRCIYRNRIARNKPV